MPKYNYKKDALTDYFKGKLSAKELDKIARDDFKSGIATNHNAVTGFILDC